MIWGGVPQRNKNFTGRESQLAELRRRVSSEQTDVTAVLPHALQGLGGVGKTHLAIEYAYRYQSHYDLIWWIPADQPALVRSNLAALAPRLGLSEGGLLRVEDSVAAVLDALRRGEPYHRWLLIFDNADQPELIRSLMPHGPGHVLVTSRNRRWQSIVDTIEVDVFARRESLEFLDRRVPGIAQTDANQLADALGDLPLALEQAGALQFETGMGVQEYLQLLGEASSRLLAENPPSDYSKPVAAAWSLSVTRLRDQAPFALELLRRCAFFGPEPISLEMLDRGKYTLSSDFGRSMQDRLLVSRAMRELGRYALAKIDTSRKTVQVHRLVQMLIRDELPVEEQARMRDEVHALLIAADPGDSETTKRAAFEDLLPHIVPSGVFESTEVRARQLIEHLIRYLFNVGDFTTGLSEADRALAQWEEASGERDPDVLVLKGIKADILWALGRHQDAYNLRRPTLEAITEVLGADHEETLVILNGHGADLRARGDFRAALELDEDALPRHERTFGPFAQETLLVANNLALDYNLNSSYERALQRDQETLVGRRDLWGGDANPWVALSLAAVARDLRQAGQYLKARDSAEHAYRVYEDLVNNRLLAADHPWILQQAKDLSVARRKAGYFPEALELAEQVYGRYTDSRQFGREHPDALAAAINLGNAQRVAGDPNDAAERIEKTVGRYQDVFGADHPYAYGCHLNLALVHRQLGRVDEAERLLKSALAGLDDRLGPDHHFTLTCLANLATARSAQGAIDEALEIGERALTQFRDLLGPDHPHTLVCATNVALDLAQLGRDEEAQKLSADTVARYRRVLGPEHPDVRAGERGERLDFDFEPPPL
ncbi:FxSxx-COOH system tetratricopeptide repeat protein [Frankia sp. Mgl5]|uniref:FxSxx-COOH system tetratricopeptide repeat protein n=1 Tax=Frankia sp. Mgl5 TaxID=2933793 RepID=UPI0020106131|nr:FxSxx-COOH system tetratricopeptide repeat protein [Frankia sp. Mgl5]MCK9930339.1 FxSxx-COOH system tetratricopeptide repeat protein [Frankia sp. Mgl5]